MIRRKEIFYLTDIDFDHLVNKYVPEAANYHWETFEEGGNGIARVYEVSQLPGTEASDLKAEIIANYLDGGLNMAHTLLDYMVVAEHIEPGTYVVEGL